MLPILFVKGKFQDCLGALLSFWSVPDESIIINVVDGANFTNLCSSGLVDELHIQRHVVSQSAVVILELFEADSCDFKSSVSSGWSSLWMEIMDKDILIVCESVLNISVVQNPVLGVVLGISRWEENDCTRITDSWRDNFHTGIVFKDRHDLYGSVFHSPVANIRLVEVSSDQS